MKSAFARLHAKCLQEHGVGWLPKEVAISQDGIFYHDALFPNITPSHWPTQDQGLYKQYFLQILCIVREMITKQLIVQPLCSHECRFDLQTRA